MSSKQVYLFIPPESIAIGHPTVEFLRENFPLLPTDDFQDFYNKRIARYSSKPPKTFCNRLEDLIPEFAVEDNMVTLISMNDKDVFAVLIFKINHPDSDLYIEILCGNKALPSTGEGTKLLKILESAGEETDQFNIDLSAVTESVNYYKKNSYHPKPNHKSQLSLTEMSKNTRALSNWSKVKSSLTPSAQRYLDSESMRSRNGKGIKSKNRKSKNRKSKKNQKKTNKKNKTNKKKKSKP